jgi:hypothetical protein
LILLAFSIMSKHIRAWLFHRPPSPGIVTSDSIPRTCFDGTAREIGQAYSIREMVLILDTPVTKVRISRRSRGNRLVAPDNSDDQDLEIGKLLPDSSG